MTILRLRLTAQAFGDLKLQRRKRAVRRWLRLEPLDRRLVMAGDAAPIATNDPDSLAPIRTTEDAAVEVSTSVLSNDVDADGDVLAVQNTGEFESGLGARIWLNPDGTFLYDPVNAAELQRLSEGDTAADSFVYQATDGAQVSDAATVNLIVHGVNDAPRATSVVVAAMEDGATAVGIFAADDIDDDDDVTSLSYTIIPDSGLIEGLVVNNADGTFSFFPDADLSFQNLAADEQRVVTFTYQATDRHSATSELATATVVVTGVNDAPVSADMIVQAIEDNGAISLWFAGDDADSDDVPGSLLYTLLSGPEEGVLYDNADGSFTFDPGDGFQKLGDGQLREFAVTYNAIDRHGSISQVGTITVHVTGTNDAPETSDAAVRTFENLPVTVNLLELSSDVDGAIDPFSLEISTASNGIVSVNSSGFTYTPNAGFLGTDKIEYKVRDDTGEQSAPGTIQIEVVLNSTRYRNHKNSLDVNADGVVTPFDALLVISFLNKNGSRPPFGPSPPYYDTAPENNLITPRDALAIMTFLNNRVTVGEHHTPENDEPEGESRSRSRFAIDVVSLPSPRTTPESTQPRTASVAVPRREDNIALNAFLLLRSRREEFERLLDSMARTLADNRNDAGDNELVDRAWASLGSSADELWKRI